MMIMIIRMIIRTMLITMIRDEAVENPNSKNNSGAALGHSKS